jgi:Concanavalin A-like lectin/glucanases superfamily
MRCAAPKHTHRSSACTHAKKATVASTAANPLQLVRSYQIPTDDPSYERLLNWSWTYDSAISAAAFVASGEQAQAQQLLDQLAALQHTNGSIELAFNTQTGQPESIFRAGTIATVGLAAAMYDQAFSSSRYLATETRAAEYLISLQSTGGLIRGGPDVSWISTQHNLLTYAFLSRFASELQSDGYGSEAARYSAAAEQLAAAVETSLLVTEAGTTHFLEGLGNPGLALDTQALGAMFLQSRGHSELALQVLAYAQSTFATGSIAITLSPEPATYNMTYAALGPFNGYEPYAGAQAPEVLWFEGTAEMRSALAMLGQSTTTLDASMSQWQAVTSTSAGAPLQANRTVTNAAYGVEYHVWPAAAAAGWVIIAKSGVALFTPPAHYAATVGADAPELWYRLGESSGTTATDSSSTPHNGIYQGGVTLGVGGVTSAFEANTAVTLNGTSGYISNSYKWTNPQTFTLEAWVKTTTTQGGAILGFANLATGAPGNYDRMIYMANSGQIYFGAGANKTIYSPRSYNDGAWHLIDATFGPSGMALYVDGALVASNSTVTEAQIYNGYWHVGYDSLGGWAAHPTSNYLAATIDEVAVYPTALTPTRIAAHYLAG